MNFNPFGQSRPFGGCAKRPRYSLGILISGPVIVRKHPRDPGQPMWTVAVIDSNAIPTTEPEFCPGMAEADQFAKSLQREFGLRRIIVEELPPHLQQSIFLYQLRPHAPASQPFTGPIAVGDRIRYRDTVCPVIAVTETTVTIKTHLPPQRVLSANASVETIYPLPNTVTFDRNQLQTL